MSEETSSGPGDTWSSYNVTKFHPPIPPIVLRKQKLDYWRTQLEMMLGAYPSGTVPLFAFLDFVFVVWDTNGGAGVAIFSLGPCSSYYWGEPERAPHLWKIVYIYVCMVRTYSVYAFCPICAWCNISTVMLYMSKDIAKLAMFESQKEVCTTHLWNPKKERKAKA